MPAEAGFRAPSPIPPLVKPSAAVALRIPRAPRLVATSCCRSAMEHSANFRGPKLRDWLQMKKSAATTRSSSSRTVAKSSHVRAGLVTGMPLSSVTSAPGNSSRWPATPLRTGRFPPSNRAKCTRRSVWTLHGSGHRHRRPAVPRQQAVDGQRPQSSRQVCAKSCSAPHGTRTPRLATRKSRRQARCAATPAERCSSRVNDLPASGAGSGGGFLMRHCVHVRPGPSRLSPMWRSSDGRQAATER
jgi:hypothetical protein